MSWLFSLLTGIPGFLNGLLAYLNKRQDTAAVFNTNSKEVATAAISAEVSRTSALKDLALAAMSHPIWWVAWALGVFPVLTYHACVYFVSTFPWWGWTVLQVPAEQAEFVRTVVGWMFGIGGASSLIAGITHAWKTRV
jgi:hypothetical protein